MSHFLEKIHSEKHRHPTNQISPNITVPHSRKPSQTNFTTTTPLNKDLVLRPSHIFFFFNHTSILQYPTHTNVFSSNISPPLSSTKTLFFLSRRFFSHTNTPPKPRTPLTPTHSTYSRIHNPSKQKPCLPTTSDWRALLSLALNCTHKTCAPLLVSKTVLCRANSQK